MLDLKALLAQLVGCANTRKLLWRNSTAVNGMAGNTTISLDLSKYDLIEIIFWKSCQAGRRYECSSVMNVGSSGSLDTFEINSGAYTTMLRRNVNVTTDGVTFSVGYWRGTNQTTTSTANDPCTPIQIYGIKCIVGGGAITS